MYRTQLPEMKKSKHFALDFFSFSPATNEQ